MAEEKKEPVLDKTTEAIKSETPAPVADKPADKPIDSETPDSEDISDVVMLLNIMDKQVGGNGTMSDVPAEMRGSIKYLIEQLTFIKDRFEDPMWMALMDDMKDQEEDGKTPSILVAIARTIPIETIEDLADNEDYEGMQNELAEGIASKKQTEEEDQAYIASFEESQKAGEEYAAEMGYDEARKNQLFQKVLDLFKVMGDGIITKEEFAEIDKMLNYDADTESLRGQLSSQASKEVLPDQTSLDATMKSSQQSNTPTAPKEGPGMGSLDAYSNVGSDITNVGKRKRIK